MRIRLALAAVAVCAASAMLSGSGAFAASHREAPLITTMPKEDGTDFYMFRSYEPGREGFITIIADYFPFQEPWGGPNYYMLDPNAVYDINLDTTGSGYPTMVFRFRFQNKITGLTVPVNGQNIAVPLLNIGGVPGSSAGTNSGNVNVTETYTLEYLNNPILARLGLGGQPVTNTATGSRVFLKPTDNIGCKSYDPSTPTRCANNDATENGSYTKYASGFVYEINIPGCNTPGRMFVGPRNDPFVVNLGETFDLINYVNPVCTSDEQTSCSNSSPNTIQYENVTAMELELPIACVVPPNSQSTVIGGWTTSSLPRVSTIGSTNAGVGIVGISQQVSRLGNPLVNEVLIGLPDKDAFNASEPANDATRFYKYFTNPTLPALIQVLFKAPAPTLFPREDLVTVFLKGVPGINPSPGTTLAEELRLNTNIAPVVCNGVATPSSCGKTGELTTQNYLGVIGFDNATCQDTAGFPNGRRPGDDVVDIELRVAMGRLIALGLFGSKDQAPAGNDDFTDGAHVDCTHFPNAFPYTNTPIPGSPNGPNGRPQDTSPM